MSFSTQTDQADEKYERGSQASTLLDNGLYELGNNKRHPPSPQTKVSQPKTSSTESWQHDMIALLSKLNEEDINHDDARRLFGVLSHMDSVKSIGGKTYNYEEKYPEDVPGAELGADARVFKVYNDEAEKYDADMVRGFRDSLDGLLVFASLFSAVVTTILMQTIQAFLTDQSR
ncbi:hypothetical protein DL96DRAFT_1639676, partial [Flagelloscypha sp. PMI_526]